MTVGKLIEVLGGKLVQGSPETVIAGVDDPQLANGLDLVFAEDAPSAAMALAGGAAAVVVKPGCIAVYRDEPCIGIVESDQPRLWFARAAKLLKPTPLAAGVHPAAVIGLHVNLGEDVSIAAGAVVGEAACIGAGTRIEAGAIIGEGVRIGEECRIYPRAVLYPGTTLGNRVIVHAGVVLGADGFGYVNEHDRWHKFPQVGRVEIGDFVEIGANCCIDRAALGVTVIGEGTKLDNMVHVAHNCRIGRHVVVAAQTGFSGSVVVEDHAVIGGQVGIGDKARIESRAVLGSGCGVLTSKVVHSGETVWGTPARPLRQHLEQLANLAKLPELRREVAELKRRVAELAR